MQRLTGLDDGFLWMETPTSCMHVASVIVVDGSASDGPVTFERIRSLYASRLDFAPPFRRRLVTVPFGLHHPLWIEDPDFDLDWHLRHISLPEGHGALHDLTALAANLAAIPLDRTRPLWEMWYIDGLNEGHVAMLTKVHHAAIDGASGEELMVAILDLEPDPEPRPEPAIEWKPDPFPTDTEMLSHAAISLAQQPVKAIETIKRSVEIALRVRAQNNDDSFAAPPLPFSAPATSINGPLTANRSLAASSLSLPEIKAVKNVFGCTVNDVVLTLCAGALRQYFDSIDELPESAVVAMIPISVRSDDQKGTHGNQVSMMLTSLATDLDDPVDRLQHIHTNMKAAKVQQNAIGADILQEWADFASPAIFGRAARLYSNSNSARHRPMFNVVISNVPGPPFPLYVAGSEVLNTYPMGPIFEGFGLNITLMSYRDRVDFGLLACPDLVPDVWRIADSLQHALQELRQAALAAEQR
ncbi:MAG: wax ester/triacylglycerol synthase family O-acyltransferase [Actinomycetes bacterium]